MDDDVDKFEDLLDHLGTGRWTYLNIAILVGWMSMPAMQALGAGFMAPIVNYTCTVTDGEYLETALPHSQVHAPSASEEESHNDFSGYENISISSRDECTFVISTPVKLYERPCTKWNFDNTTFTSTITSEMELVCDRAYMVPLYQSFYMIGALVGAWIGGIFSDKFGRRPMAMASTFVLVITGTCTSWLPNISMIFVARFLLGFCHMSGKGAVYGLAMETVPPRMRATVGIATATGWGMTVAVLGGLGYLIREWRRLQLVMSLPFVLLFPAVLLMDESPRWLIVHGRNRAAYQVLNKVAVWHRVPPFSVQRINNVIDKVRQTERCGAKSEGKVSMIDRLKVRVKGFGILLRTPRMRQLTIVVCLDFFTASLVYFSVGLGATNFKADPYIYMAVGGLVDVMSSLMISLAVNRVGRKVSAITCFSVTGITLIGSFFIPEDAPNTALAIVLLGRFTIISVFSSMYLYASEVFPTEVRLQGLGTGLFISRCGSIISPFINDILTPLLPWSMKAVAGGLSLAAGISSLYLPETKDIKLPDLVKEVEENPWYRMKQ